MKSKIKINHKFVLIILFSLILLATISSAFLFNNDLKNLNKDYLKVTTEHPFYINGKWIKASELKVGDNLTTADGKLAKITNIKKINEPILVYNLEDSLYNNYIANGIVVHNSNSPFSSIPRRNLEDVMNLPNTEAGLKKRLDYAREVFGQRYVDGPSNIPGMTNGQLIIVAHSLDDLQDKFNFLARGLSVPQGSTYTQIIQELFDRGIAGSATRYEAVFRGTGGALSRGGSSPTMLGLEVIVGKSKLSTEVIPERSYVSIPTVRNPTSKVVDTSFTVDLEHIASQHTELLGYSRKLETLVETDRTYFPGIQTKNDLDALEKLLQDRFSDPSFNMRQLNSGVTVPRMASNYYAIIDVPAHQQALFGERIEILINRRMEPFGDITRLPDILRNKPEINSMSVRDRLTIDVPSDLQTRYGRQLEISMNPDGSKQVFVMTGYEVSTAYPIGPTGVISGELWKNSALTAHLRTP